MRSHPCCVQIEISQVDARCYLLSSSDRQQPSPQVEEVMGQKDWSVSRLSALLQQCLAGLTAEMSTCEAPLQSHTKLPELRPFTRRAVHCLPRLAEVLDVRSSMPHPTPYSREQPVVGSKLWQV